MNKIKQSIRDILLNNIVLNYNNNKSRDQIIKNHKNFGLLEKSLNNFMFGGNNITVNYNDENYIFDKLDDPYSSISSYVLLSKNNNDNCVVLTIDKENSTAILDNLSSTGLKCSNTLITDVGKHLVKITIKLLTDHSFIFCKMIANNIALADLYTLKYGLLGFVPINENTIKKYNKNYKIINKI